MLSIARAGTQPAASADPASCAGQRRWSTMASARALTAPTRTCDMRAWPAEGRPDDGSGLPRCPQLVRQCIRDLHREREHTMSDSTRIEVLATAQPGGTRLHGRRLVAARVAWLLLFAAALV